MPLMPPDKLEKYIDSLERRIEDLEETVKILLKRTEYRKIGY